MPFILEITFGHIFKIVILTYILGKDRNDKY
jgi:hypothetical protein